MLLNPLSMGNTLHYCLSDSLVIHSVWWKRLPLECRPLSLNILFLSTLSTRDTPHYCLSNYLMTSSVWWHCLRL